MHKEAPPGTQWRTREGRGGQAPGRDVTCNPTESDPRSKPLEIQEFDTS